MKYAVISDIHGNLPALEAVLEDARRQGITRFLFAGDYCISGPRPDECVSAIREIPDKAAIRGNEEKYLENLVGRDPTQWTDGQMQISYWTFRNMRKENLDYVLSLPHRAELKCNGLKIRMAHSSVDFVGTYPFWTWNSVTIAERNRLPGADPEKILADIAGEWDRDPAFLEAVSELEEGVYIFGHSHIQWSYKVKGKDVWLINPGSCGLPLGGIRNRVPYTVLEIGETGQVRIEERNLPFDKKAYIESVRQTSQFREANVWSKVIERELAFATEHIYYFLKFTENYAREIGDERRPFAPDTWEKAFALWEKQQEEAIP